MIGNKNTEDKVIQALGCLADRETPCAECINACIPFPACKERTAAQALEVIKSQRAEIARLNTLAELGAMRANDYRVMRDKAKNARAEAVKEFAERLKGKAEFTTIAGYRDYCRLINNLVKEMTGETE